MDPTLMHLAALAAGFGGGVMNALAGGGTNLTFPTLLALGVDPILASSTSTVCLGFGQALGAWAYRSQIQQAPRTWLWLGLPAVLGGALGGWLLVHTPSDTFRVLVPYLVLGGASVLALDPWLRRRFQLQGEREPGLSWCLGACGPVLLIAVYGGYFGAGMGFLMLATLGLLGVGSLQRANGLKNLFGALLNLAAVGYFLATGAVVWGVAGWMLAGALGGGYTGGRLAGRIPDRLLRPLMVALGLGVGLLLLL